MQRRKFVKSSILTAAAGAIAPQLAMSKSTEANTVREFYELRTYSLGNTTQQQLVESYFKNALIPALNRLGSKHVGLFSGLKPEGQTKLYALIPYNSVEDFISINNKLLLDRAYQSTGAAYLNAAAARPAYQRIESSLLKSFAHMPVMDVPEHKQRI